MAILIGATITNAQKIDDPGNNDISFSYTPDAGATMLIVAVGGLSAGGNDATPSGVTWNGNAMTKAIGTTTDTYYSSSIWYYKNPGTSTHNIVASWSTSTNKTVNLQAFNLSGINTTASIGSSVESQQAGGTTSGNVSVTSVTTGSRVLWVNWNTSASDPTESNATEILINYIASPTATMMTAYTDASGTVTNSFSWSGAVPSRTVGLEIREFGTSFAKVLAVGGGGGGGSIMGGGGGGGAVQYDDEFLVTASSYAVTVGAGGAGGTGADGVSTDGGDGGISTFNTTSVVATGGGGGGTYNHGVGSNGRDGSSGGGGGGADAAGATIYGGTGSAGYDGGDNFNWAGGGGGGAGGLGVDATSGQGGNGGAGMANSITGSPINYGGGGGAAAFGGTYGTGTDGGGDGNGSAGAANTGSGGGGNNYNSPPGGDGGSGVVIVAYQTSDFFGFSYSGSYTTGTNGSETWIKMTTSGNLVINATSQAFSPMPTFFRI